MNKYENVIRRLLEGNLRFVSNKSTANNSKNIRNKVAYKQKPFAAILSCSDSRVPPEIIFDQGLGELFVIRTAGAILDQAVIASLELGVIELQIPVLFVLGHKRCGAVKAAMDAQERGGHTEEDFTYIIDALQPAIKAAQQLGEDIWSSAIDIHIKSTAEQLLCSSNLKKAIENGSLEIVLGRYDLDSGLVEILSW